MSNFFLYEIKKSVKYTLNGEKMSEDIKLVVLYQNYSIKILYHFSEENQYQF